MTTIKDVAKEAGVSVATVSRVINNSSSVSEKTRERVSNAIKKLKYNPNLLGRNLRRMETKMIIVLLPTIANYFYAKVVKGIEDVAHKNGYNIMLCNTDSDPNREYIYINLLKNRLSDGIIFLAPEIEAKSLSKIAQSYPVVQCCEYKEGAKVSHVCIDNFDAAYTAVKHLITLGHKRIAMISADNNFISTISREQGYKKALEDFDIIFDSQIIKNGNYGFKSGFRAAKCLMNMPNKPTAIFAISDMMAIGAIKAIKNNALKVPDDIAVVGFDNIKLASIYEPSLTTISQPQYDLGCVAMKLLLNLIKGTYKDPQSVVLEHDLIIRQSTFKS